MYIRHVKVYFDDTPRKLLRHSEEAALHSEETMYSHNSLLYEAVAKGDIQEVEYLLSAWKKNKQQFTWDIDTEIPKGGML